MDMAKSAKAKRKSKAKTRAAYGKTAQRAPQEMPSEAALAAAVWVEPELKLQRTSKPSTNSKRKSMADRAVALPRLRKLALKPAQLEETTNVVAEIEPAAVDLGPVRIQEEGEALRLRNIQRITAILAKHKKTEEAQQARRARQQQEVSKLLAEVDARISQVQGELRTAPNGITRRPKPVNRNRIDRMKHYADCSLELRLAVFNIINAVSQVETAQTLHGSRQPAHLEKAEAQLQECQSRLYAALRAMKPMKEFVPSYARATS